MRLFDAEGRHRPAGRDLRIPPGSARRSISAWDGCPSAAGRVLVAASVLGREFGLDALALLGGLPRDELLDLLDEAMAERVVGEVPGSPGRLRFAHALIGDTLYDELTRHRRLRLHRRPAKRSRWSTRPISTHTSPSSRTTSSPPRPPAGRDKAVDYARRAGDRAASQLAYEEAVRLYEMALALADEPVARCELLLALGDAQARAGDTPAQADVPRGRRTCRTRRPGRAARPRGPRLRRKGHVGGLA